MTGKAVLISTVDPWALSWLQLNDDGNAQRLVARAAGRLVHVREWGWLAYDGKRWSAEDGQRLASLMALEVSRGMRDEIEALAARDDKELPEWCNTEMRKSRVEKLSQHAVTSGNAPRTKAMLDQAANLDDFNRRMEAFDSDLLALNAANCTLRFKKVPPDRRVSEDDKVPEWEAVDAPHDPANLITRVASADWDPKADMSDWQEHMAAVLPSDEVRRYFQKIIGYAALGLTVEQVYIMLQGKGGDGKSTTMDVLRIVLGLYAVVGNVKTFLAGPAKDGGAATPELIRFVGDTRLISVGEPKRGQALAEEMVKAFTGGSALPARANYGDEFEFEPRGKVVMEVNARPRISGDDDGIWGRIVIILFPRQFRRRDGWVKEQKGKLLANRAGILRWIVEGAVAYLNEGLTPPAEVAEAIEEYRRSANPFSEWMAERVDTSDPTVLTLAADLFGDYKEWCEAEQVGEREIMSSTAFGRALGDRQIIRGPKDRRGKIQRRGARLRPKGELAISDEDRAFIDGGEGGDARQ